MRTAQTAELQRFGDLRRSLQIAPIVVGLAAALALVVFGIRRWTSAS